MAPMPITEVSLVALTFLLIYSLVLHPLLFSPLAKIPGPKAYALTKWRLAYEDWRGTRTRAIDQLHQRHGPVVRTGPNEVSFNSLGGLRAIYGPGSPYGRTSFYRMFDVYGRQNLFTFHSAAAHGRRKRLVSHAYSKTVVVRGPVAALVEAKAAEYMKLLGAEPDGVSDVFRTLHYYSLDAITAFLYGRHGSTSAMMEEEGSKFEAHRALIGDILDPARRRLSWFAVHWPGLTKWLYTRTGWAEAMVRPLLPMRKPATYTGIRRFALEAYRRFEDDAKRGVVNDESPGGLDDLDIASECADHLLAGIDTTSDTLMFLIWALSRPQNQRFQDRLRDEVRSIPETSLSVTSSSTGIPTVETSDRCTYLGAVIKETLRLYSPLPAYEPRSVAAESAIDGYTIPANTTVGSSPFSLHRNPDVFKDPLVWDPERWLSAEEDPETLAEMNRWFWAFSSGGRMCIGLHLAMAEMTTLTAAIYRKYRTSLPPDFEDVAPGITSRFEVFSDDRFSKVAVSWLVLFSS
ncbi:benzoate 4-monooxygenase cytochrome P450 [Apiospora hydei]|uniref:Benzoate 4-monooxygenase cytochrome P450 n=1 Tax=Apiospora hydei TaxID=1337664 RepID=A0ABR1V9I4_9PEZI